MRYGPYTIDQIQLYLQNHSFKPTDLACKAGENQWQSLDTLLRKAKIPVKPLSQKTSKKTLRSRKSARAKTAGRSNSNVSKISNPKKNTLVLVIAGLITSIVGISLLWFVRENTIEVYFLWVFSAIFCFCTFIFDLGPPLFGKDDPDRKKGIWDPSYRRPLPPKLGSILLLVFTSSSIVYLFNFDPGKSYATMEIDSQKRLEIFYEKQEEDYFYPQPKTHPYLRGTGKFGKQDSSTIYMQNKPVRISYENGQLKAEGMIENGKREGEWTEWYQNGKKASVSNYVEGRKWNAVSWKPNGEKCPVTKIEEGNGIWAHYLESDGSEIARVKYENGRRVFDKVPASTSNLTLPDEDGLVRE